MKRARTPKPVIPSPTVKKVIEPKWCDGDILPTHLSDILDKAIETENKYRLYYWSIDEISTDDESGEEPDSETDGDSDLKIKSKHTKNFHTKKKFND